MSGIHPELTLARSASRLAELDDWRRLTRAEAEPVEGHLVGVQRPLY